MARIDLKRKRYEYSRGDCANMMSEFDWNVALFIDQSGGRGDYGYGRDRLQYPTENDAPESPAGLARTIIHPGRQPGLLRVGGSRQLHHDVRRGLV